MTDQPRMHLCETCFQEWTACGQRRCESCQVAAPTKPTIPLYSPPSSAGIDAPSS